MNELFDFPHPPHKNELLFHPRTILTLDHLESMARERGDFPSGYLDIWILCDEMRQSEPVRRTGRKFSFFRANFVIGGVSPKPSPNLIGDGFGETASLLA